MGPTLLTLGVILLVVGLIGQVKAREIEVGTQNPIVRVILGLIGLTFVLIALYQSIPPFQGAITNTATLPPTSSAIVSETPFLSSPPTTSIAATTAAPDTAVPPTATFTPIPPTAAPIGISNTYNIAQYGGEPGTQRSIQLDYIITVRTVDLLQFEFSVPSDVPSSDVILHILWDDVEIYTSDPIGGAGGRYTTNLIDLSPYVSQGVHKLTISPEGVFGGGNVTVA